MRCLTCFWQKASHGRLLFVNNGGQRQQSRVYTLTSPRSFLINCRREKLIIYCSPAQICLLHRLKLTNLKHCLVMETERVLTSIVDRKIGGLRWWIHLGRVSCFVSPVSYVKILINALISFWFMCCDFIRQVLINWERFVEEFWVNYQLMPLLKIGELFFYCSGGTVF